MKIDIPSTSFIKKLIESRTREIETEISKLKVRVMKLELENQNLRFEKK